MRDNLCSVRNRKNETQTDQDPRQTQSQLFKTSRVWFTIAKRNEEKTRSKNLQNRIETTGTQAGRAEFVHTKGLRNRTSGENDGRRG